MRTKPSKVIVDLEVTSTHVARPAPALVAVLIDSKTDLSRFLRRKYGPVDVHIDRRKGLPLDPGTVAVTVAVIVSTKLLEKVSEDIYAWAKRRLTSEPGDVKKGAVKKSAARTVKPSKKTAPRSKK